MEIPSPKHLNGNTRYGYVVMSSFKEMVNMRIPLPTVISLLSALSSTDTHQHEIAGNNFLRFFFCTSNSNWDVEIAYSTHTQRRAIPTDLYEEKLKRNRREEEREKIGTNTKFTKFFMSLLHSAKWKHFLNDVNSANFAYFRFHRNMATQHRTKYDEYDYSSFHESINHRVRI